MSVRYLCGDSRDLIREMDRIDAIVTDPVWPNVPPGLIPGWEEPEKLLAEVLSLSPASVRRVVIVLRSDSDPRFLRAVPQRWPFVCMQAMSYAVPMYLGRVLGGTEIAYCFGEPVPSRKGRRVIPMWGPKVQPRDRPPNGHPCSRSPIHMAWLTRWWMEEGETVLDPFSGSGTIPLAAHRNGGHGIGIEIDPGYVALAEKMAAEDAPLFSAGAPARPSSLVLAG